MGSRTVYRTCPLCEALCGLELTVDGAGAITSVRGDREDPLSAGFLCPKGATLGRLDGDPDRLDEPLVRGVPVGWDKAFSAVRDGLAEVIARYGRDAVAIYVGNPAAHSVAGPLYGSALIKALGTRNVYTASTADQMPKHVSCGHLFGDPLAIPVPDLDRTDHLLMLGANPLESNGSLCSAPDFGGRLKAIRARGGRVVVVDPRRTRTAALADEHLFVRPGTDAHLLMALVHTLFAEELTAVPQGLPLNGLDELRALVVGFSPERVAPVTGVPAEVIRRTARELAAAERAAVYGRIGTCTQEFGTLASWLVDVLNILTGNLDHPGGAMFPRPAHVPVYRRRRPFTTGRWRSRVRELPEAMGELPVATLADEIETPGEGQVRALITVGGNPVLSAPDGARLDRLLPSLDLVVSVDPYLNETTRHAHVVLPPPRPAQTPHYDLALLAFTVRDYARYSPPAVPLPDGRPAETEILARLATLAANPNLTHPNTSPAPAGADASPAEANATSAQADANAPVSKADAAPAGGGAFTSTVDDSPAVAEASLATVDGSPAVAEASLAVVSGSPAVAEAARAGTDASLAGDSGSPAVADASRAEAGVSPAEGSGSPGGVGAGLGGLDELVIMSTLGRAVAAAGSPVHGRDPGELRKVLADGSSTTEQRLDMMLRLGPYGEGFGANPNGLTLARLRDEHPHGLDLGPLKPRLHEVLCTASRRIELCPPAFAADTDRLAAALDAPRPDLVLIGRRQLRSNNSWLHNVPELLGGSNTCTLHLNPADAERLGIGEGARVRVTSRTGAVEAVASPTDTVMPGVVSLPHGWGHDLPGTRARVAAARPGVNVNAITDDRLIDPLSGNAAFNGVPVTLTPLPSPL
ncbi:molybdopterin-dependent oxidoreductase [Actinomadura oligospora]|uniref:molybdopterin-dependent oxidoreductase n=1 Tax=Actinomadura oligospora TaxID=111804 RepID=UPI0004B7E020|nr:molybdopterin-dependent oxidoreductase [Actinomadura oligospora]